MAYLKLFLLALGFYTRLPVPKAQDFTLLPQSSIYLPLVGWLIGALMGFCFYGANLLWSQTTAVILSLACGIFLTGAFHEDGFADVCDGFGGGYDKLRILEIMKDSQIGVYGALGLMLLMALKISLLSSLPSAFVPLIMLASHSISRFQPLVLMWQYDYVRSSDSKSGSSIYKPRAQELFLAGVVATLPLLLLPLQCGLVIPVLLLVNWRLGRYFYRHIGGYTGDCLGAGQQLAEVVFYLGVSAFWTFI